MNSPHTATAELRFTPRAASAPSSDVAHQLIRLVTSGGIQPGERLPPERHLQALLGVGRSAIREALAALALLGLVEIRAGSGSYLRDSTSSLLPAALSWGMMLNAEHTDELLDLRRTLEVHAVVAATSRMTAVDHDSLDALVSQMRSARTHLPSFVEADAAFHRLIAERAGNTILRDLLASVSSLLRIWMERAASTAEHVDAAVSEHAALAAALRARDVAGAAAAMRAHMDTAANRVAGSTKR